MRRDLRENHTNIIDASNAFESQRKFKNYEFMWDYIGASNYEKNLNYFLKLFHSNVLIIDFKNLMGNQHDTAYEIFSFLGLKKVNIQEVHSNKSGFPPSNPSIIYRLLKLNGHIRKIIRDVLISLKIHNFAKRISQKIQFLELEKKQLQSHEKDYLWTYLKKEVEFYNSLFNEKN